MYTKFNELRELINKLNRHKPYPKPDYGSNNVSTAVSPEIQEIIDEICGNTNKSK